MRLFRFRHSPFARKVQMVLELLGTPHDVVDVPYVDRSEMARLTGGYILVPVLVDDAGAVTVESRDICQKLLSGPAGARLVPAPLEGPIWAYADFIDGPVEDLLFRVASPFVRDQWKTDWERGLYVFSKERKFGAGCIDAWQRDRDGLLARARRLLAPSVSTLGRQSFLFGAGPTLADAALYGVCAMLEAVNPELVSRLDPALPPYLRRVEAAAPRR
ncbi:MAG TPA: glutathione S-transferase [Polyangia bacterium]